jgi:hypothetical protein
VSRVPCPRQRVTVGGYRYSHRPRQARITQQLYVETGPDGKRRYTVAQIAAEFGVTPPPSTGTSYVWRQPNAPAARAHERRIMRRAGDTGPTRALTCGNYSPGIGSYGSFSTYSA